jgi:sigma-B regulation protein RsbU (phosphoserine phosphatase)
MPWRSGRGSGSSRRELELLVRERTAELELAIEQMESADTIIDRWTLDGVIHYMNDFGLRTLGYTVDEVVGRRSIHSIVPDDPDRLAEWIAVREQLEADPHRNVHSELQCRHKDGSIVWVAFRNRPILDGDDNIVEVFSVGIDITDRKLRESRLVADNRRMGDELSIGREIQLSMLPDGAPEFPGHDEFTVRAVLEPAREVGGDFYDFFLIDDHHLCVCVGDVSDKGVPAALYMAVTKTLIASRGRDDGSPSSIIRHVNDELCRGNDQSMFVTIFVGVLDTRTGTFEFTNAGHNPPILRRADGTLDVLDARHGPVAGVLEGFEYGCDGIVLDPGDQVVMFTDGVTEAMDPDDVAFGDDQLLAVVGQPAADPAVTVRRLFDAVAAHTGDRDASDDVTILALGFHGAAPRTSEEFVITLDHDLTAMDDVIDLLARWMVGRGVADDDRRALLTIADDLLANAIEHTGGGELIEATLAIEGGRLVFTVRDDGPAFNPFEADSPDTTASIEDRRIGGLGIHLARALMHEHEYDRVSDRNVVRVSRRIGDPGGAEG